MKFFHLSLCLFSLFIILVHFLLHLLQIPLIALFLQIHLVLKLLDLLVESILHICQFPRVLNLLCMRLDLVGTLFSPLYLLGWRDWLPLRLNHSSFSLHIHLLYLIQVHWRILLHCFGLNIWLLWIMNMIHSPLSSLPLVQPPLLLEPPLVFNLHLYLSVLHHFVFSLFLLVLCFDSLLVFNLLLQDLGILLFLFLLLSNGRVHEI